MSGDLEKIAFRPAGLADAGMLLEWRNDPQTRRHSLEPEPTAPDRHVAWLSAAIVNPSLKLLIAELAGRPVGTVRFDLRLPVGLAPEYELSWTVAPAERGQGVGIRMVRAAAALAAGFGLCARIKEANLASLKIAAGAGFARVGTEDGLVILRRAGVG